MTLHRNITVANNHMAHAFEYADATARGAATGFVSGDVGKLARQLDDNSLWLLSATTPTWVAVGSGAGGAVDSVNGQTGTVVLDADDISDSGATHKWTTAANLTKLAGIEAGAEVTSTAKVSAAGAVMTTATDASGFGFVVDEDGMSSDSATKVPTQQSVKAYVDAQFAGAGYTDEMARDAIGAALVAGSGIAVTVNDGADTITITNTSADGMANPMTAGGDLIYGAPGALGANLATSGAGATASAISEANVGETAAKAIDGNDSSDWKSSSTAVTGDWLAVDLGSAKAVAGWRLKQTLTFSKATAYKVQKSSDGSSWTDIVTHTVGGNDETTSFASAQTARYFRVLATAGDNFGAGWCIDTLELRAPGDPVGDPYRLGIGGEGQVLKVVSGLPAWAAAGMTSPMTTQDDLIVGGASGAPARLAKGSDGQVLTVDPATHHLVWATPSSGFADPTTTKGDLIVHGASTTRLAVGTNGQVLTADSSQATGLKWAAASGGGPTLTPPVVADFTWTNQGTATAADDTNGLVMTQAGGGSNNIRALLKNAPATPYVITAKLQIHQISSLSIHGGIGWSDGTGFILFNTNVGGFSSLQDQFAVSKWTSITAFSADYVSVGKGFWRAEWWRISDDGTNRKCWISNDNVSWVQVHSVGRTDFITPTKVGLFLMNAGSYDLKMTCEHWAVT